MRFLAFIGSATMCVLSLQNAHAQVVQLPSMRSVGYTGTVSVPDAGLVPLGSASRGIGGIVSRGGLSPSRSIGNSRGSSGMNVAAVIMDLKAMDDVLLNSTLPPSTVAKPNGVGPNMLVPTSRTVAGRTNPPGNPNAWQMALAQSYVGGRDPQQVIDEDVRYFLHQADDALRQNRIATARVFHRMALDRMNPEMLAKMRSRSEEIRQASLDQMNGTKNGTAPAPSPQSSEAGLAPDAGSVSKAKF